MLDNLLSTYSLAGTWIDLVFIVTLLMFITSHRGFIVSFLELTGLFFSFIFSLRMYILFSKFLAYNFDFSKGIANAFGFFIAWFVSEILFTILSQFILQKVPKRFLHDKYNRIFGAVPAILQAVILFAFSLSVIMSLPVQGWVKKDVLGSKSGPVLLSFTQTFETQFKNVFNDAITETLNFLTVKQESGETVDLGFKLKPEEISFNSADEQKLFQLVNRQRREEGVKELKFDPKIQPVARDYAKEMFLHGFFSHTSAADDSSPSDRMDRAGIRYFVTGENLAFAPDVNIAHTGLMNSPGHRANILSKDYGKIGIGVADGGVFGKLFVQEFTN